MAGTVNAPLWVRELNEGGLKERITQYLSSNGDGTGTVSWNGNYASAEGIGYIQPPAGAVYRIEAIMICVEDTDGMTLNDYGTITSGISNGVQLRIQNDSGTLKFLTGSTLLPVKKNLGWGSLAGAGGFQWVDTGTGDPEAIFVTLDYSRLSGQALRLVGDDNERLEAVFNDNLSGLLNHTFFVYGYIE